MVSGARTLWKIAFCRNEVARLLRNPGGTILLRGHRAMESITLDREVAHLKDELMPRYAKLIYNGYWWLRAQGTASAY